MIQSKSLKDREWPRWADPSATILQREGGERKEWLGDNQKLFRNLIQKLHKSLTHVEWPLDRRKPCGHT